VRESERRERKCVREREIKNYLSLLISEASEKWTVGGGGRGRTEGFAPPAIAFLRCRVPHSQHVNLTTTYPACQLNHSPSALLQRSPPFAAGCSRLSHTLHPPPSTLPPTPYPLPPTPTPHTLLSHPTHYIFTLHPPPYPLPPTPYTYTLHPALTPYTLHTTSSPCTLHLKPHTPNPQHCVGSEDVG